MEFVINSRQLTTVTGGNAEPCRHRPASGHPASQGDPRLCAGPGRAIETSLPIMDSKCCGSPEVICLEPPQQKIPESSFLDVNLARIRIRGHKVDKINYSGTVVR